jgi:hypothetical protein
MLLMRRTIERLILGLCVWEFIVLGSLVVAAAATKHTVSVSQLFNHEALSVYGLVATLGVITTVAVFAIAAKLTRLAASLTGLVLGLILSVLGGLLWGSLIVRGFEGPGVFLFLGVLCAVPSGVAAAIVGYLGAEGTSSTTTAR